MHMSGLGGLRKLSALAPLILLNGCNWSLIDPQGPVGASNLSTIGWATLLMLLIVVPVLILIPLFAWHFREGNKNATYAPNWSHSNKIEVVIWTVPALIVLSLAVIAWYTTHTLDPYRPLESKAKPVEVEVVALDWKWLFIYPEYHIASVNELAMPVGRPVNFKITSASVMNSFFIPQLGSQIYAMAGMQTQLHLMADRAGTYEGMSANFSGDGFSDMRFPAQAMDEAGFQAWIAKAQAAPAALKLTSYQALAKPSERNPVSYYGTVDPAVFPAVLAQKVDPTRETQTTPSTHSAHQE